MAKDWTTVGRRGLRLSILAGVLVLSATAPSWAQDAAEADGVALSFQAAAARLDGVSSVRRAADANVLAAEAQAGAVAHLNRPTVSLDAQLLRYQKTFDIDLGDALGQAQDVAGQLLPGLIGDLPGVPGDVLQSINDRLQQALPEFFASLPGSVRLRTADTVFRPVATAVAPLYTGGAIPALRDAAGANVELARARQAEAGDIESVNLVRAYFGQTLTREALTIARDTRDGFDLHLRNAQVMEREGVLSAGQRLQVQVARDAAQRQVDRAELEHDTAVQSLSRLMDVQGRVRPTSPLFVNASPAPPVDDFIASGAANHPRIAQAQAGRDLAEAGVDLARSRFKPSVFAFGTYNLNPDHALPTEPDWAVGVGARLTLLSSLDRGRMLGAAQARAQAAEQVERGVRDEVRLLVIRAYNLVELSRRQFLSLDSSLAAATENLRIQDLSFREGEAPASAVIDARNLLGTARLQRAAAAYEYELSLAALLAASHRSGQFADYLNRADRVIAP
ncbi:MAG: TolC family protein [Candidatus Brevundimonas colombiensis]|uniref:TolC family protein n=1 Tax=Candidatus Brevundimonas colombiensis TaxID=3121376 RepID=A0AAJ5X052_9CAUL|nr:TolC family protein [Brevundimonas sp.]WEK38777.1 MAG: TolC family protein [Brevundimonas sp.]